MTNKAVYQPWSEESFSSDIDVQCLSSIERWMYRTLCQKAFVCSTRPFPPDDDALLWKLSGCPSIAFWNQHKEPVRAMFVPRIIDQVPVLFRQRLADDWSKIQGISDARRQIAKDRWQKMQTDAIAMQTGANAVQVSKEVRKVSNKSSSKTKPPPTPAASPPPDLPIWLPESTWKCFCEMRVKMRAALSPHSSLLIFKKLASLLDQGESPQEVLEQSIINGWRGVFPLHRKGNGNGESSKAEQRSARVRESIRQGLGVDSKLGRALRGELREGTDSGDEHGLPDRLIRPAPKLAS
jgi:hypothetical protein